MLVEVNELSVGACFFGMVIWENYYVLLERYFLRNMVDAGVVMELVVEVVVVESVDVVQAGCVFHFS